MEAPGTGTTTAAAQGLHVGFGRVFSWGLFDFANTIFSANILSLYFALWVTVDHGAQDIVYSLGFSGSMLAAAVTSPMLGAVSDQYGRRIPFLLLFTVICVAFTAIIGRVGGLTSALLFFGIANFAYQSGNVFYDALLPTVSHEGNRGRISGFGVALGYVGAIAGILMVKPFVDAGGREAAFLPTALLFLLFALPSFLFVQEARPPTRWTLRLLKEGYTQILSTLRNARDHADLLRFIAARFLYVDSVNTLLTFMAVYVTRVIGFADDQVRLLLIVSTSFAIVGAVLYGRVVEWIGPKKTLSIVLIQWALVFIAVAATFYQPAFWVIGAVAGVALGGTWTADRVLLTRLAPPERVGEYFGLYRVAGRFAAVIGPLIWGGTLWALAGLGTLRFRIGVLVLLVPLLLGYLVLMRVKEQQPAESNRSP